MTFSEHLPDVEGLDQISYGCFVAIFTPPLRDEMKIRHVFGKLDQLIEHGNYGKPIQFFHIFKELCDYLNGRRIPYRLSFRWTWGNNLFFNLSCLGYLIANITWLKTL